MLSFLHLYEYLLKFLNIMLGNETTFDHLVLRGNPEKPNNILQE